MSQDGRGCLVGDQGGSDKVAHVIIHRGFGNKMGFSVLLILFCF